MILAKCLASYVASACFCMYIRVELHAADTCVYITVSLSFFLSQSLPGILPRERGGETQAEYLMVAKSHPQIWRNGLAMDQRQDILFCHTCHNLQGLTLSSFEAEHLVLSN